MLKKLLDSLPCALGFAVVNLIYLIADSQTVSVGTAAVRLALILISMLICGICVKHKDIMYYAILFTVDAYSMSLIGSESIYFYFGIILLTVYASSYVKGFASAVILLMIPAVLKTGYFAVHALLLPSVLMSIQAYDEKSESAVKEFAPFICELAVLISFIIQKFRGLAGLFTFAMEPEYKFTGIQKILSIVLMAAFAVFCLIRAVYAAKKKNAPMCVSSVLTAMFSVFFFMIPFTAYMVYCDAESLMFIFIAAALMLTHYGMHEHEDSIAVTVNYPVCFAAFILSAFLFCY